MPLVIDASVALSWVLADEGASSAQAVLDRVLAEGAMVPGLWNWEVQNALRSAERRKRIDLAGVREDLTRLRAVGLELHMPPPLGREIELARKYDLTVYAVSYLDLALRNGAELATMDRALAVVAYRLGVLADESLPIIA
jgi:predicted nucleic acid-binding protein